MVARRNDASVAFAGLGVALLASYFSVSANSQPLIYEATSLLGVTAVIVGLRWRLRGRYSRAWRLFTAAVVLYAAGDALWCLSVIEHIGVPEQLSDGAYLASYPFFAGALVSFSAARREPWDTIVRQLVDAAIVFVAAYTAVWFLWIDPVADRGGQGISTVTLDVLYPTFDLALLALLTRFAFTSGRWPASYRLLTAAFGLMFVGDMGWRLGVAQGSYTVGSWINTLFMAASVLWGAGALHPSVTKIEHFTADAAADKSGAAWRRLTILAVTSLIPAFVLVLARRKMDDASDVAIFATVLVLLPLLSLARIADMLRALRRSAADFNEIVTDSPVPICVVDHEGTVLVWNQAAETASGHTAAEVLGGPPPLIPAEDTDRVMTLYRQALEGKHHHRVDVRLLHADGHPVDVRVSTAPLHDGAGRVVAIFEDVTREREHQEEVAFLASHDPLTGLPNRRMFENHLRAVMEATGEAVHLVLFDIDNFKLLNDEGGHTTGDRVLRELSGLLLRQLRGGDDFLARLSGDEFALILSSMTSEDAVVTAQRLLGAARDYRLHAENVVDVTLSAGIYTVQAGDTANEARQRADEALYRAKRLGKNRLHTWADSLIPITSSRRWSPFIKDALREDRIDLYAQPIVDLRDGSVRFHEALCRLRTTGGDVIPAGEWISEAERLGLMPEIDITMLQKAQAILKQHSTLRLFVNLSPTSVHDDGVLRQLDMTLQAIPRGALGIELTEHAALTDPQRTRETLGELQALGALIAIDDFGLGFTSFSDLATLPCDIVKIPSGFAGAQARGDGDDVIAKAIALVAHAYGKEVVLEGIENAATVMSANAAGIEYGQGWYFGRPAELVPSGDTQATHIQRVLSSR